MSYIFDSFEDENAAQGFVNAVWDVFQREGTVYLTAEAAQEHDPTIAPLIPPVVHIPRDAWVHPPAASMPTELAVEVEVEAESELEAKLERLAAPFGGVYVGT